MERLKSKAWLWAALLGLAVGGGISASCIPEDGGGGGVGPPCHLDSDCVSNGCCGEGSAFVDASNAPDCSAQVCDGSCPLDQVNCGCGIAHCSDSQCVTAVNPDCGGKQVPVDPGAP